MKTLKILFTTFFVVGLYSGLAQEEVQNETSNSNKNTSQETVTKIIRIKGANGEEKVIKKEEVITKKGKIKFDPEDGEKTDQTAVYEDANVSIKSSETATSNVEGYSKVEDGKGYIITFTNSEGSRIAKVRPLKNDYYLVHMGKNDNCIGHFDDQENFILERYDPEKDVITSSSYKPLN